jgi:hypothetical protein
VDFQGQNSSATAATVANALNLVNPIKLSLDGRKTHEIRGDDLYALNALWLNRQGLSLVATTATDENTHAPSLYLPVMSKAGSIASTLATYAAVTNMDTGLLTLVADISEKGYPERYEILTTAYTASGTGQFLQAFDKSLDGKLQGIMFFSTTLQVVGAATETIDTIRIKVNGETVMEYPWATLQKMTNAGYHDLLASPASAAILDNYAYLDLSEDAPKKGDRVIIEILGDDTNAVRIVTVEQVAN